MKKRVLKALFLISTISPIVPFFTACNKSESQVLMPSSTTASAEISSMSTAEVKFYGFEYKNLDPEKLIVTNTFLNKSNVGIDVSIINIDKTLSKFDLRVAIFDCSEPKILNGEFNFLIDGKQVNKSSPTYTIDLSQHKKIVSTSVERTKYSVLKGSTAKITLSNFSFIGNIDENVTCNFVTESPLVQKAKIVNLSQQFNLFDIELELNGCTPNEEILGDFEFFKDGQKIEYTTSTTPFSITCYADKQILTPQSQKVQGFIWDTNCSVTITNFISVGFTASEIIPDSISLTSIGGASKTVIPTVENFDQETGCFDIKISNFTTSDIDQWEGKISFNGEKFVSDTMIMSVHYPISTDKLNIVNTVVEGQNIKVLKGFVDGFSLSGTLYDTIYIPTTVRMIDDNAFLDKFKTDNEGKQIKNILFSDSILLQSIGENAFSNCNALEGDLILPESINTINASAFAGCSGFNGTLFIPFNGALTDPLIIKANAFQNCKFTQLDISEYLIGKLPKWHTTGTAPSIFSGWDTSSNNKIVVCQNVFESDAWKQQFYISLKQYSFPTSWIFAKK